LGISLAAFNQFNTILVGVTAEAGVNAQDNAIILSVLQGTQSQIVAQTGPSAPGTPFVPSPFVPGTPIQVPFTPQGPVAPSGTICNRYSFALNVSNRQLVALVVNQTVLAVVVNSDTKPFFDGTVPPGSTNYLDPRNAGALTNLNEKLIEFFGAALGCSDGSIPPYSGGTMKQVHAPLGISGTAFSQFNAELLRVLSNNGVSNEDVAAVGVILESLRPDITGQQPNAPFGDSFNGPNYVSKGVVAIVVIFAVACALVVGAVVAGVTISLSSTEHQWDRL